MEEDSDPWGDKNKYRAIMDAWAEASREGVKINKEVKAKIKSKFMNAESISKDRFSERISFHIGNITLATKDEGETFSITDISGKFTQDELKPILMWATLEDASK